MIVAFFIALAVLLATTILDVRYTSRGIAKKLAIEGNSWIVGMFGNKPSAVQLYLSNALFSSPMVASGIYGLLLDRNAALLGLSIGTMTAYSLKHIHGARSWAKLGA